MAASARRRLTCGIGLMLLGMALSLITVCLVVHFG
jgi:hypothetical protein